VEDEEREKAERLAKKGKKSSEAGAGGGGGGSGGGSLKVKVAGGVVRVTVPTGWTRSVVRWGLADCPSPPRHPTHSSICFVFMAIQMDCHTRSPPHTVCPYHTSHCLLVCTTEQ